MSRAIEHLKDMYQFYVDMLDYAQKNYKPFDEIKWRAKLEVLTQAIELLEREHIDD